MARVLCLIWAYLALMTAHSLAANDQAVTPERNFSISVGDCILSSPLDPGDRHADLRSVVASLLVTGFPGNDPASLEFNDFISYLDEYPFGGFIFLQRNVRSSTDVRAINGRLETASTQSPFIMVDEEGGAVSRLQGLPDFPRLPPAREVAQSMSVEGAFMLYSGLASTLGELGFNVNLGPVVDLERNPFNPVIARHRRSFGSEPGAVISYARAFARAHAGASVLTAVKHFPGHGSSRSDTHYEAADITDSWRPVELLPFAALIAEGHAPLVMTSHVTISAPQFRQREREIATFSANIVAYIREELCHSGLIITDDLTMSAITGTHNLEEAIKTSLRAGHDLIVIAARRWIGMRRLVAAVDAVADAAERDSELKAAIMSASHRVRYFKERNLAAARPSIAPAEHLEPVSSEH